MGGNCGFRISDDGPGIDSEHLPHVFSPFYRVDRAPRESSGHLGLGLFIVQSHVKAMGGVCRIDSEVGRGTVAEVEVPCEKVAEAGTQAQKLAASSILNTGQIGVTHQFNALLVDNLLDHWIGQSANLGFALAGIDCRGSRR
jgi:hypothetical protein